MGTSITSAIRWKSPRKRMQNFFARSISRPLYEMGSAFQETILRSWGISVVRSMCSMAKLRPVLFPRGMARRSCQMKSRRQSMAEHPAAWFCRFGTAPPFITPAIPICFLTWPWFRSSDLSTGCSYAWAGILPWDRRERREQSSLSKRSSLSRYISGHFQF